MTEVGVGGWRGPGFGDGVEVGIFGNGREEGGCCDGTLDH